jgi:exodeoxyribonuclease VII large subunit
VPSGPLPARSGSPEADAGGADALSITELYSRVDRVLRMAFSQDVWITGEIRTIKVLPRGHCFIDLVDPTNAKDTSAPTLNVKCWSTRWRSVRSTLDTLGIALDAGMIVRVRGRVEFYKARGTVDFILSDLDTDALLGKVAAARARLIKSLVDEGLFDRQRMLPAPALPLRLGLVASPRTEGFSDFMGGLTGSGLAYKVKVIPTAVQGRQAAPKVAAAVSKFQSEPLDVIVVVRGGGSKADLASFDHERVARAIATSAIPVWTGIGHTGDQSVADEVANRSFITPTECGQEVARLGLEYWRAIEDSSALLARLAREQVSTADRHLASRQRAATIGARSQLHRHSDRLAHRARTLRGVSRNQIDTQGLRLAARGGALIAASRRVLRAEEDAVVGRARRLSTAPERELVSEDRRIDQWHRLLGAYDYRRQLERGYSVTRDEQGRVVRSVASIAPGSHLLTRLSDGEVTSSVEHTDATGRTHKDEGNR